MGSILVFISIILLILFIGAFLYLEIQNEKRLREIFTRRVKECEEEVEALNYTIKLIHFNIDLLISDIRALEKEVKELKHQKQKKEKQEVVKDNGKSRL